MEIARIEIPQHIRQVQMSAKQRPIYFIWNGISIISERKNIKIPRSYYRDRYNYPENIKIEDLKEEFCITVINKRGKIVDYYHHNFKLPVKVEDFIKDYKYILHLKGNDKKYTPVFANDKKVDTPKIYLINGQDIYNGYLHGPALGKVIGAIKECFRPHVEFLPVIEEYPIDIVCEIHDTIKNYYVKSRRKIGGRWDVDNYAYPYLKAFPDFLVAEKKIRDDDRLHIPGTIPAIFIPIEDHNNRKLVFIVSKTTRAEIINNETYQAYHKNPNTYETEDSDLIKDDEPDTGFYKLKLNFDDERI